MTNYRPDIDGLRALAVLAVVAYHVFPGKVPGGFVGVDVFFVISGYLITSIIYNEIVAGTFSIVDFYARRIRRIFPALICVLLATLVIGLLILLPEEYAHLVKHVIGGLFFYSNLLLWSEVGYFDLEAQVKPLLHLWSLGVEEQYYLIWPVVLLCLWAVLRSHSKATLVIIAIAGISFSINVLFIAGDPTAVFYSPVTRTWELLVGAALAVAEGKVKLFRRAAFGVTGLHGPGWITNAASTSGAALIAGSIVIANTQYQYPGWLALAPTLGAALLIGAGPAASLNAWIFASRPAVFIGKISYPLYLWHWPLLSFVHIYEPEVYSHLSEVTNIERIRTLKVAAVCIAFVAAILTYHLVEKSVKKLEPRLAASRLLAVIAALVAGLFFSNGLSELRGPIDGPTKSQLTQPVFLDCVKQNGAIFNGAYSKAQTSCFSSATVTKLDVLVFGDSHGMDLYRGIENSDLSIGLFEANACMPLDGFEKDTKATCSTQLKRFYDLVETHKPATIVVSLYFSRFYAWYGKEQNLSAMAQDAFRKMSRLSNLVIMVDVPILTFSPDNCQSRPIKQRIECVLPRKIYADQRSSYEQGLLDAAQGISNVTFVDPEHLFCSGDNCYGAKDGILLYRDSHHLTNEGSNILGKWFLESYTSWIRNRGLITSEVKN